MSINFTLSIHLKIGSIEEYNSACPYIYIYIYVHNIVFTTVSYGITFLYIGKTMPRFSMCWRMAEK